jgi:hypothetical protein
MFLVKRSEGRTKRDVGLAQRRRRASPLAPLVLAALLIEPAWKSPSKDFGSEQVSPSARWKGFEVVPGNDPNGWSFYA